VHHKFSLGQTHFPVFLSLEALLAAFVNHFTASRRRKYASTTTPVSTGRQEGRSSYRQRTCRLLTALPLTAIGRPYTKIIAEFELGKLWGENAFKVLSHAYWKPPRTQNVASLKQSTHDDPRTQAPAPALCITKVRGDAEVEDALQYWKKSARGVEIQKRKEEYRMR
jgi:hypothetical protein